MGRRRSVKALDREIIVLKSKIVKTKARYEAQCSKLNELQEKRDQAIAQEVLAAIKRSGKSYSEVMTFLGQNP